MKSIKIKLIVFTCSFTFLFSLSAQEQMESLKIGKTIYAEIAPGQKHQYTIKLKKDQNVRLKLLQDGMDVKIITYDQTK